LKMRDVRFSVGLFTLSSFAVVGWNEIYTVWLSTELHLSGLGFSSAEIGSAVGLSSVPLLFLQLYIFPKVESHIGAIRTFQVFCAYLIFCGTVMPATRALLGNHVALWTVILILRAGQEISVVTCFSSCGLFVNNSVPPWMAGSVNGLAMTAVALGRAFAPLIGGSLFSWSLIHGRNIGFPFDVNLAFLFFGIVYLSCNVISVFLPLNLEKQKKRPGGPAAPPSGKPPNTGDAKV